MFCKLTGVDLSYDFGVAPCVHPELYMLDYSKIRNILTTLLNNLDNYDVNYSRNLLRLCVFKIMFQKNIIDGSFVGALNLNQVLPSIKTRLELKVELESALALLDIYDLPKIVVLHDKTCSALLETINDSNVSRKKLIETLQSIAYSVTDHFVLDKLTVIQKDLYSLGVSDLEQSKLIKLYVIQKYCLDSPESNDVMFDLLNTLVSEVKTIAGVDVYNFCTRNHPIKLKFETVAFLRIIKTLTKVPEVNFDITPKHVPDKICKLRIKL